MGKEEEDLANAEECEANALRCKDPDDRATWHEMAACYLRKFGAQKSKHADEKASEPDQAH
jgi:hypothetical protein